MAALSTVALAVAGGVAASQLLNKPKQPDQQPQLAPKDPAAEQAAADTRAAQNTNAALAAKNKARKASSLLAAGDPANQPATSALGYGKQTLGA